jgi:hypothetical protein
MALLNFDDAPHGGSHKLLPEWDSQPRITPTQIIDHTVVGTALGAFWFFHDSTGIESHFIIRGRRSGTADGHIWQLMDTGRQADANLEANARAISIETEDNGARPIEPWSPAQLDSLEWLHDKLVQIHPDVQRQNASTCTRPGLGYHSQLGSPSCRTPAVGKDCPAPARISQWNRILLPAFVAGRVEEDDMPYTEAEIRGMIQAELNEFAGRRFDDNGQTVTELLGKYRGDGKRFWQILDRLDAEVAEIKAKLDQPPA